MRSTGLLRRLQQRLFTGGLFSEEVNDQLVDFARRHMLTSSVWVPVHCLDSMLKDYCISVQNTASLLSVPMENHCDASREGSSSNLVVVNAEQTSHVHFLEEFVEKVLMPSPQQGASHYYPVSAAGEPITHTPTIELLKKWQRERNFTTNYWTSGTADSSVAKQGRPLTNGWYHAEEHRRSGRFNAVTSVHYIPRSLTNHPFPPLTQNVMRERAMRYGYVSRLWLTESEALRLWGAVLKLPSHLPLVSCSHFTGGLLPAVYHCADQYSMHPSEVPRDKETNLAASGVNIGDKKLKAFPLLAYASRHSSDGSITQKPSALPHQSASRHETLSSLRVAFSSVRLFDCWNEKERLSKAEFEHQLRRERFLRGFKSPYFIRSSSVLRYGLQLKDDSQQGVVVDAAERFFQHPIELEQECWLNADQLKEPAVVHELATRHPKSVIWGYPLRGVIATLCARLQVLHRWEHNRWMLGQAVPLIPHWSVRDGAVGVPFLNYDDGSPCATFSNGFPLVWYNLDDVEGITESDFAMLEHYKPMYESSKPVRVIALYVALTLRAIQKGFHSPVWIQCSQGGRNPARQETKTVNGKRSFSTAFSMILPEGSSRVFYEGNEYVNSEEYSKEE